MRGQREDRRSQAQRIFDEGAEAHEAAEDRLDRVLAGLFIIVMLMLVAGAVRLIFWL